jgi:hypothetical protein
MATRLYFRNIISSNAPTAGSKSTALPDGTNNSPLDQPGVISFRDSHSLLLAQGTSNTTVTITTLAQTTRQSGRFARFTSEPLASQTISANTWDYTLRNRTNNISSNTYKAGSIYVWRPSTSSVVGYVYDSNAEIGLAWTTNFTNDSSNISGSSVTASQGDVLVIEVWYTSAQSKAKSFVADIQYNVDSYIETPQDLTFFEASKEIIFGTIIE